MAFNSLDRVVLGFAGSALLLVSTWVGSSLNSINGQLPAISDQLIRIDNRLASLEDFRLEGARFTAEDGLTLAKLVQDLEKRVALVEQKMKGGQ
jgi:hypothetical protein